MTTDHAAPPAPTRPTFDVAADLGDLEALPPVDRVRRISELARILGTLPPALYRLRRQDLRHLRRSASADKVAAMFGMSPGRVKQITGPMGQLAAEAS